MPSGQASTTNYSSPTTSPPAATSTGGTSSQGGSTTTVAPKVPTSTTSPGVSNHRKSSQSTTTIAPSLQALGLTPTAPAALNGNLATPQMVKALVQAGQRGPAMGYNKGYGLGSAGGPPGPVPLAQSIPSPTEAMHSFGKTAGQNSILTFLLIFLIGLPSLIFNSTLKEHHGNIASTHGAIRRFIDRIEAWLAKLHTAALLGFFAVIGSLLYAVVDPTFGFNLSSLAEIVGYVGAIILSTGVTEIARGVYVHRKFKKIGDLRAFPLGIVMAAAFDVFSRVAHFEPGFVFGILAAMVFRVEPTGEEDGRSIALSSIWLMGVSTVCWIVWIPVKDAVIGGNHNFLVLCVDALLSFIWICGLQSLFFGLIPVKSMDGDTVFKWSKITWALIYLIVTFVFVQFIIHPSAAGYGGNSHTSLIPLLSMFFAATVAAAVFWTYTHFKFGNRSTKTDEGKIAVDAIT